MPKASRNDFSEFKTLALRQPSDGVLWVELNRPKKYNAFNQLMQDELACLWAELRRDDTIRAVVLSGSGEVAFCTGIDRDEVPSEDGAYAFDPLAYDDPGLKLGPKSNGLWKPVIAAVNGMACGGAFYLLSECDVLIAADHATFFDPHVTYGMAAIYEPTLMRHRMTFGDLTRMMLLGAHERVSAKKAEQMGLISESVPMPELGKRALWLAETIASQPPQAVQATLRNLWLTAELSRNQALQAAPFLLNAGNSAESLKAGQRFFTSGNRIDPRLR